MAFLLETWGCLNESLVQYDELDAMFSQFVINAGSGRKSMLYFPSFFHNVKSTQSFPRSGARLFCVHILSCF